MNFFPGFTPAGGRGAAIRAQDFTDDDLIPAADSK
jgi:hypothetical protein